MSIRLENATLEAAIRRAKAGVALDYRTGQAVCTPRPYDRRMGGNVPPPVDCPPVSACRDVLYPLVATAVAAGAGPIDFGPLQVPITMRVDAIIVVTSGAAGFTLQDFWINNNPQWTAGGVFHSAIFAPGADANTSFRGDYIQTGNTIRLSYTNLDGGAAQSIWVALKGPGG